MVISTVDWNSPGYQSRYPETYPPSGVLTKDDTHVLVSQKYFDSMNEYSSSLPSGQIVGKHWKCLRSDGVWIIRWYEEDPTDDKMLLIPSRIVVIV